ncbi:MAG: TauD/TfdA family dioxygenase [Acetobacteraceae bacterium]|nr:TauD/TfdA family dioxygenase [Acetobacteraceae bacterium]
MLKIEPTGAVLGATVHGLDLSSPVSDRDFGRVLNALGAHGVLHFPDMHFEIDEFQAFSLRFGDIQGQPVPGQTVIDKAYGGVGTLSNLKENGQYIGAAYAGQDWHTDMSYRETMGFVNLLYGIRIPRRDGKPLGGTEFSNMHAAHDALPEDLKARLTGMTASHSFEKFWEHMRVDKGADRPPMTDEQRRARPPVTHPLFLTHPISGRKVLYCNPGYTTRINELPPDESDRTLNLLFEHQLEMRFRHTHHWTEHDLIIWDHIGTIHRAIDDYGPDDIRLMRRCQIMANKVFDPAFLQLARAAA